MGFYCCFKRLKFIHVFNFFQFDDIGYNALYRNWTVTGVNNSTGLLYDDINLFEPGFRPGLIQTRLYSHHKWLEA